MNRAFVALAVLTCVAAAPALAVDTPAALGRAEGIYTPRAGTWEFSLTAPAFPPGTSSTQGVGATIHTGNASTTDVGLGLTAGLGYSVTDLVEVGGAFFFEYSSKGGVGFNGQTKSTVTLQLEPFVKLNFGSGMARDSRINPFVMAAVGLGFTDDPVSSGLFSLEIAGGVEFMLTHRWGISVYVPLSIIIPTASNSNPLIGIGLGYGLCTYFD